MRTIPHLSFFHSGSTELYHLLSHFNGMEILSTDSIANRQAEHPVSAVELAEPTLWPASYDVYVQ